MTGLGLLRLPETERQALLAALSSPSYEVIPLRSVEDQVIAHAPRGMRLSITAAASRGQDTTIWLAERLAGEYAVVPHLSAQLVKSRSHLGEIVARCRAAGIGEAFVVGGDRTGAASHYVDAASLLEDLQDIGHPFDRIGIAGHPEGHSEVPDNLLMQALVTKAAWANDITTQMSFNPSRILNWTRSLASAGVRLPVRIGIPGAVSRQKLLRISAKLGLRASAGFLAHQRNLAQRFFLPSGYRPNGILRGVSAELADPDAPISGFHLFTFNDVAATEVWRRQMIADMVSAGDSSR